MWNVPDDWNMYYRRCDECGAEYHLSEGGCGCYEQRKEELWHETVDRLRHSTIDMIEQEKASFSGDDDLGDYISKGFLQVRVYITEPDEKIDELVFSINSWEELKPVIGYIERDENENAS
jgi:hypothetical protein